MKINKTLYYILNLTWGLPLTFIGLIVSLVLLICGFKPKKHAGCWYFEIGKNWGGFELGLCFVKDDSNSEHIKNHEFGHGIQNALYGPFGLIFVNIPSVIRYWYRHFRAKKHLPNPPYDSIWFEGQATEWGTKIAEIWEDHT